ncbi:DUF6782 family putative metallopeptidase [Micavibrio aeruginosavorus]|uniref:DUF6782 family putative metallopeptidase n=1 Tax=Micavibrio aeruginosavorus TaxID=349221 RepID=UPI003F4AAFF0
MSKKHTKKHPDTKNRAQNGAAGWAAVLVCVAGVPAVLTAAMAYHHFSQPHRGEENRGTALAFADLPTKGDGRIKYLIAKLRTSPEGERLFQFAARTKLQFIWGGPGTAMGSYSKSLMSAKPGFSDDITLLTIAHETRHHWQHTTMNADIARLEPLDQYAVKRLREVDACAYAAHFSADFKDATGHTMKTPSAVLGLYGGSIAMNYAQKDPATRDAMRDAYAPCMESINSSKKYNTSHAKTVFKAEFAGTAEGRIPHHETGPIYRAYFKTSVADDAPSVRGAATLSDQALRDWATDLPKTNIAKAIKSVQRRYEEARNKQPQPTPQG